MLRRILGLNQYGIFMTRLNSHIYLEWEEDLDSSPTEESKLLLKKLSERGISLRSKRGSNIELVLDEIDVILKFLGLPSLEGVGLMFE